MFTARAVIFPALFWLLLVTATLRVGAQELSASLDSAHIEIGNTTHLRLKFTAPAHQAAPRSISDELRVVPELELLEEKPFQKTAGGWEQAFQLVAFKAGEYNIPVPVVDWGDSLYQIAPLRLVVTAPPLPADGALAPIKDIIVEPRKLSDHLLPALIAAPLLLFGAVMWRSWRRKKKNALVPSVPELPPHIQAQKQLEALQHSRLWDSDYPSFYVRLSSILRAYIAGQYGVPALTETTDIILLKIRALRTDETAVDALSAILRTSDLVKFAKAAPDESTHARLLEAAFLFVEKTGRP